MDLILYILGYIPIVIFGATFLFFTFGLFYNILERLIINPIKKHYFGQGIIENGENFTVVKIVRIFPEMVYGEKLRVFYLIENKKTLEITKVHPDYISFYLLSQEQ